MHRRPPLTAEPDYSPFPDQDARNWRQQHLEIPLMVRALRLPRGARILEVGCGRGIALAPLANCLAPARLAGVDFDAELLGVAKRRICRELVLADLVVADVRDLPFPDGAFDMVLDFGTCFHISRSDAALRQIARVITSGGIFVTEMKLNQVLSHPVRSRGRSLPWEAAPSLAPLRRALLWESRRRVTP